MLLNIIAATFFVSSFSLISVALLATKQVFLKKITKLLVAVSAGSLMGATFFHLLPEGIEHFGELLPEAPFAPYVTLILAYVAFFVIEKWLHWQHCHEEDCQAHTFGYLNLVGDAIHNFLDGMIIAGAFVVSPGLGVATTVAIMAHEIPQEISDFGVLLHAGFSKQKALLSNFLVALFAIAGGLTGYFLTGISDLITPYLVMFAAGGFLYISSTDLMPELRNEPQLQKAIVSVALFLGGVFLMLFLTSLEVMHG
jgi:zinc and cadmium transporter